VLSSHYQIGLSADWADVDSGGASGLSSLMILEQTMVRLQHMSGLAEPPDLRDHFDIVAGTGTGA
jgi:hypothetical protein